MQRSSGREPNEIWVDKGSTLYNRFKKKFVKENDIKMYSTHKINKYMISISMNVEDQNGNTLAKTFCKLDLMQRNQNVFIVENAL